MDEFQDQSPGKPRQLTLDGELQNRVNAAIERSGRVFKKAQQEQNNDFSFPSADELLQETEPDRLVYRIMAISGKAIEAGRTSQEASEWAQRVSRELHLSEESQPET